jgi:NADPH2:quinone reductase
MRAVQISAFGGPEVLEQAELPMPEPRDGQVLIEVRAAGINYADTHTRTDDYLISAALPLVPGGEVVGVRRDTGERVLALCGNGGYAEYAVAPEALTFPVPDAVDDGSALALLVQGVTAWHLLRTSTRLAPGESVLVHAGAGGVGSLAVQLARIMGAGRVVATASSEEKRRLAVELGAHEAVAAEEIQGPFDVVLEMTGGEVFEASLSALAPFGRLVTYGNASRHPNAVDSARLMRRSRAVIGFWLMDCVTSPTTLIGEPLAELFRHVESGELRTVVGGTYPLADAGRAHADLEARRTTGKLVLDPVA